MTLRASRPKGELWGVRTTLMPFLDINPEKDILVVGQNFYYSKS
jgi:hypothetical protein